MRGRKTTNLRDLHEALCLMQGGEEQGQKRRNHAIVGVSIVSFLPYSLRPE